MNKFDGAIDMEHDDDPAISKVRDVLERRGWSQRQLADKALLGESTVFRMLKGHYTAKTLRRVERALGLTQARQTDGSEPPVAVADIRYGGYVRELYNHYEGQYMCLRPGFADLATFSVYPLTIAWSEDKRGLTFTDGNPGYEQQGMLSMPTGTQYIHLITLDQGSARLITAYHMPPGGNMIRGIMLTFANPRGRELYPAVAPIVMARDSQSISELSGVVGQLSTSDPRIARHLPALDELRFDIQLLRG